MVGLGVGEVGNWVGARVVGVVVGKLVVGALVGLFVVGLLVGDTLVGDLVGSVGERVGDLVGGVGLAVVGDIVGGVGVGVVGTKEGEKVPSTHKQRYIRAMWQAGRLCEFSHLAAMFGSPPIPYVPLAETCHGSAAVHACG